MNNVIFDAEEKKSMLSNGYYSPFSRRIMDDYEKLRMCSIDLFQLVLMSNVNNSETKEQADNYLNFIKNVYPNNRKYLKGKDYIGEAIANAYALLNVIANKICKFNYEEYGINDTISIDDISVDNENNKVHFFVNYSKISDSSILICPLSVQISINFKNIYAFDTITPEYREAYTEEDLAKLVYKRGHITYKLIIRSGVDKNANLKEYCEQWFNKNDVNIYDKIIEDLQRSQDRLILLLLTITDHIAKSSSNLRRSICENCEYNSSTDNQCDPLFIPENRGINKEDYEILNKNFKYEFVKVKDDPIINTYKFNSEDDSEVFDIITSPKQKMLIKDALEKQLNYIECISNDGSVYTDENKGIEIK